MEESRERIYKKVSWKIRAESRSVLSVRKMEKKRLFLLSAASVAALLVVSAGLLCTYHLGYRQGTGQLSQTYIETKVPNGTISSLTLPDGTQVVLNSGSTLVYPSFFAGERQVLLSGEAYFDVAKDEKGRPFVAHSDKLSVKVKGTCFSFKAYKDDHQTTLTLESGHVNVLPADHTEETIALEADEQLVFNNQTRELERKIVNSKDYTSWKDAVAVKPEEQYVLDNQTGKGTLQKVETDDYTSWKEGVLTFRDQTLAEIAAVLERRFDVGIRIGSDVLSDDRYGAQFKYGENLEEILEKLSYKRNWTFKKQNGIIQIETK